jgi:glycosyltransferase involved in cell wall biosynthesis
MKIGIILPCINFNYSAGVMVQGRMWAEGLHALGHDTYLINQWDYLDYDSLDFIIILGQGLLYKSIVSMCKTKFHNTKIVFAPIIDSDNLSKFKFRCKYIGSDFFKIQKQLHDMYLCRDMVDLYLARSEYEKRFIHEGLRVPKEKIQIVPISMRYHDVAPLDMSIKEDFCFHASRLADPNKNVNRLIEASKKYGFKLKLCGTLSSGTKSALMSKIQDNPNIEYVGYVTDSELADLYRRAKVFALPSFQEGGGMVALEAAVNGCEIVLTEVGAPKEYYNGRAVLVNPYDVDSIGMGVIEAMTRKNAQPELRDHILNHYSLPINMKQLETSLLLIRSTKNIK